VGIVIRQTVKSTISTITGAVLGASIVFLQAKFIPEQEVGFIRLLTQLSVVVGVFIALGMQNTVAVYYHKFSQQPDKLQTLLFYAFAYPIALFLLLLLPYFLLDQHISNWFSEADKPFINAYYWTIPLFSLIWLLTYLMEQFLYTNYKTAITSFLREFVIRVLNISIVVLYIVSWINYTALIVFWVLSFLIILIMMFVFAKKTTSFKIKYHKGALSKLEHKEILYFAMFHLLLNLSSVMIGYVDVMSLSVWDKDGLVSVAVYSTATYVINTMYTLYRPMVLAAMPKLTEWYKANRVEDSQSLFLRTTISIQVVSSFVLLVVVMVANDVRLLLDPVYHDVAWLIILLALGRYVDMITGMTDVVLSISKYYKAFFYLSLFIMLSLAYMYYLTVPEWGVFGAAVSTTICIVVFNLLKYALVYKKLGFRCFNKQSFKVFVMVILSAGIVYLIPQLANPILDAAVRCSVLVVVYGLLLLKLKPSQEIHSFLETHILSRIKKA
jgi:O-antigen/teichoic acid export membrane protein